MLVSLELSYYPLTDNYSQPVKKFIAAIDKPGLKIEPGSMSSLITGDYKRVMEVLNAAMGELMENYPSVFTLKISNSCPV